MLIKKVYAIFITMYYHWVSQLPLAKDLNVVRGPVPGPGGADKGQPGLARRLPAPEPDQEWRQGRLGRVDGLGQHEQGQDPRGGLV